MTTFKPGDRVISPLLVGEWEYRYLNPEESLARVNNRDVSIWVPPSTLSLIATPLPPEPPVGTVGWVDGKPVCRDQYGWSLANSRLSFGPWISFAYRFVPAVPKPTVEEVLDALHAASHREHASNLSLGVAIHAALWPEEGSHE